MNIDSDISFAFSKYPSLKDLSAFTTVDIKGIKRVFRITIVPIGTESEILKRGSKIAREILIESHTKPLKQ